MEWLSQNWIWMALGIGALFMMLRRGGAKGGGCCGTHGDVDRAKASGPEAGESNVRQQQG